MKRELKVQEETEANIWVRLAITNIRSVRLVLYMRLFKRAYFLLFPM